MTKQSQSLLMEINFTCRREEDCPFLQGIGVIGGNKKKGQSSLGPGKMCQGKKEGEFPGPIYVLTCFW